MGESMKFVPFNSMINPGFWTSLTKTKLDVSQPFKMEEGAGSRIWQQDRSSRRRSIEQEQRMKFQDKFPSYLLTSGCWPERGSNIHYWHLHQLRPSQWRPPGMDPITTPVTSFSNQDL